VTSLVPILRSLSFASSVISSLRSATISPPICSGRSIIPHGGNIEKPPRLTRAVPSERGEASRSRAAKGR
jgi:hypothetical protein